jgi:hypothetical protein
MMGLLVFNATVSEAYGYRKYLVKIVDNHPRRMPRTNGKKAAQTLQSYAYPATAKRFIKAHLSETDLHQLISRLLGRYQTSHPGRSSV